MVDDGSTKEIDMPGQAPPLPDERELLLAFLNQQRDGLRYAAFGLTDEQAPVWRPRRVRCPSVAS